MKSSFLTLGSLAVLLIAGCSDSEKKETTQNTSESKPTSETSKDSSTSTSSETKTESKPANPAEAGVIRGTVSFEGEAPKRAPAAINTAECIALHKEIPLEEKIVVNNGKLKNVFVSVKRGLEGKYSPPQTPVTIDQHNCLYLPHVVGVQVGQELKIMNSDPFLHNVKSESIKNNTFNEGMSRKGDVLTKKFDKPEFIIFQCGVHPWMNARIGVFAHPFFSITQEDGNFELRGLPPGNYTIQAWHETLKTLEQEVTLGAKEEKAISFSYKK